jgi:hypothetical protein
MWNQVYPMEANTMSKQAGAEAGTPKRTSQASYRADTERSRSTDRLFLLGAGQSPVSPLTLWT